MASPNRSLPSSVGDSMLEAEDDDDSGSEFGVGLGHVPPATSAPTALGQHTPTPWAADAAASSRARGSDTSLASLGQETQCARCGVGFTFFMRRHHCRSCLAAVCYRCSANRLRVKDEQAAPVRVCDACFLRLTATKQDEQRMAQHLHHLESAAAEQQAQGTAGKARGGARAAAATGSAAAPAGGASTAGPDGGRPATALPAGSATRMSEAEMARRINDALEKFKPRLMSTHRVIHSAMEDAARKVRKPTKARVKAAKAKLSDLVKEIKALHVAAGVNDLGDGAVELDEGLAARVPAEERDRRLRELSMAQGRYRDLQELVAQLELEMYFPAAYNWKLRLCVDEGVYIAAKDIGLEQVRGSFAVTARHGKIVVKLTKVRAVLQLYEFKLKGDGKLIKLLSSILSPTLVSLDVEAEEIIIPISFHRRLLDSAAAPSSGGRRGLMGLDMDYWDMDREAVFGLRVTKNVQGAASAPDKFVQWIANTMMPKVIKKGIRAGMPAEIGYFLLGSSNRVHVSGDFCVTGDLAGGVWHADLAGNDRDAYDARTAVRLPQSHAVALSRLCRAGRFEKLGKEVSLRRLYWYLRTYGSDRKRWEELLDLWSVMANSVDLGLAAEDPQWFAALMRRVDTVGHKWLTVKYDVSSLSTEVDLQDTLVMVADLHLKSVYNYIEWESSLDQSSQVLLLHQRTPPVLRVTEALAAIAAMKGGAAQFASALTRLTLAANGVLVGGTAGSIRAQASNVDLHGALPVFAKSAQSLLTRQPAVTIATRVNEKGEYVVLYSLHEPKNPVKAHLFEVVVVDIAVNAMSRELPGSVNVLVDSARLAGPLAPLLELDKFFSLEENDQAEKVEFMPDGSVRVVDRAAVPEMADAGGGDPTAAAAVRPGTPSVHSSGGAGRGRGREYLSSDDEEEERAGGRASSALSAAVAPSPMSTTSASSASSAAAAAAAAAADGFSPPSRQSVAAAGGARAQQPGSAATLPRRPGPAFQTTLQAPPDRVVSARSVPGSPRSVSRTSTHPGTAADDATATAAVMPGRHGSVTELLLARRKAPRGTPAEMVLRFLTDDVHSLRVDFGVSLSVDKLVNDPTLDHKRLRAERQREIDIRDRARQLRPPREIESKLRTSSALQAAYRSASECPQFECFDQVTLGVSAERNEQLVTVKLRADLQNVIADIMSFL